MEGSSRDQPQEPVHQALEENPDEDPTAAALNKKYRALDKAAFRAEMSGRFETAIACYRSTVKQKIRDYGEETPQTAMTLHSLGMAYYKARRYNEVEECLLRALKGREAFVEAGGADEEAAIDAANTRDALGRLYEGQGRFDEARKMRLRGKAAGHILCGNPNCLSGCFELKELLELDQEAIGIGEPQTTIEEANDAAQTVEGDRCPEDQEEEELLQAQLQASTEAETSHKILAETETLEGISSLHEPKEDSKSQIEPPAASASAEPAEANISPEVKAGDSEQPPRMAASSSPKTAKKPQKPQPRKQAPQISYQKWEKAIKRKEKQSLKEKPEDPVVASSSSAGGPGSHTEPPKKDPATERVQSDKDQEEYTALIQEITTLALDCTTLARGILTTLREDTTSSTEVLPATDQQETIMPQGVESEVSEALEPAEDQRETSQLEAEGPVMADIQSAEGQGEQHEPEQKGPIVRELSLSPPLEFLPEDFEEPLKKKPVVIARTPVAPWNEPGGSGVAPWAVHYLHPGETYVCTCIAYPGGCIPYPPRLVHYALNTSRLPQPWQPGPGGSPRPRPGGVVFRPGASTFMPA
ncbi:hypothetical protein VMCG_00320 [Cytospora schulzeri]|uniref:Uncharacterized protein n=1 Tax=Cytospora schulzeri TaxID=448051 RepID=A0A423X888_9PEZI|nr:hypothetical protein VMCG_00320 [Valsa malicola]